MSKNVAMFVDVANLYYAARGQDVDVDYIALLKHATKGRDLIRAYAYSGLDPENENQKKFIDFLNKNGYKVLTKDIRKFTDGRVKANLDIELVVDLFRLADRMDIAVIVSGDGDFAPAIKALQDKGVRCEVISFRPNTSSDLIAVADEFTDAMKLSIGRDREAPSVLAEMPAKEVVPEFGFREASPHVAAAAKAALRGGDGSGTGRSRGGRSAGSSRGTGRRAPAAETAEPVVAAAIPAVAATADEAGENGHRRRRRRGGRGRGRGHRPADETPGMEPTPATGTEWQEFTSVDELGELTEDKTYTFEEADAATLAELGLAAPTAAPAETPKPRRTRAPKAAAAEAPAVEAAEEVAAPKPRRRASTKATAEPKAAATAKPKTSGRKPKAAPEPAQAPEGEADAEGIWQRFTSGRTSTRKKPPTTEA